MRLLLALVFALTLTACDSGSDSVQVGGRYAGPVTFPGGTGPADLAVTLNEGPTSTITGTGSITYANGHVFAVEVDGTRTEDTFSVRLTPASGYAFDFRFAGNIEDDGRTLTGQMDWAHATIDPQPLTLRLEPVE